MIAVRRRERRVDRHEPWHTPAMFRRLGLGAAALLVVSACEPKDEGDETAASNTADDEASSDTAATGDSADSGQTQDHGCAEETRDDDYMLGLERAGEHVRVRFVDAMPAPPARYDNTWTIEVLDLASDTPIDEVELEVEPFMPDHNHGTSIACDVKDTDEPGQLELDPVNLFMPGLWEVRLHFTLDEGATDEVVFRFCVDP